MKPTEPSKKTDRSPQFYQYYPRLFHPYFSDINQNIVDKVSDASYSYYHSILLIDKVIDDGKIEYFPNIIKLQEDTIKTLTSILGLNSNFWNYWEERKYEYFEANQIDKELKQKKKVTIIEYENLADKKSAMGKVAIDLMSVLSDKKNQKTKKKLMDSHYFFSVAFQLYDDIQDFKIDFIKNQFNWAVYSLKNEPNMEEYINDPDQLNKIFYISGKGESLLNECINYIQKSIDILETINIDSEWLTVNYYMKETLNNYLGITKEYVENFVEKNKQPLD